MVVKSAKVVKAETIEEDVSTWTEKEAAEAVTMSWFLPCEHLEMTTSLAYDKWSIQWREIMTTTMMKGSEGDAR